MFAAAISPRGGVAHKPTCLRGQGLIEYVLIAAVIGLVVVFAGPQVSGAIRNQLNRVSTTLDSGTNGSAWEGGAGGGSAGAASVQAAVAKDAKDWTLGEQKAVAEDIAAKGEASPAYTKAKAAMDAGMIWSVKLTNGETMTYRIIGINHDDLADGSGKAGLTFEATNRALGEQCIDSDDRADGTSWGCSELRQRLNSGDLWSLLPSDMADLTRTVAKLDYYPFGNEVMNVNVFILSENEIYGGDAQYEYYSGKSVSQSNYADASLGYDRWTRTPKPNNGSYHSRILGNGSSGNYQHDTTECYVCPAFCF